MVRRSFLARAVGALLSLVGIKPKAVPAAPTYTGVDLEATAKLVVEVSRNPKFQFINLWDIVETPKSWGYYLRLYDESCRLVFEDAAQSWIHPDGPPRERDDGQSAVVQDFAYAVTCPASGFLVDNPGFGE